jgi:hypothetical protein
MENLNNIIFYVLKIKGGLYPPVLNYKKGE